MPPKHFCKCNTCGQWFDMRSLSEVFRHEHDDTLPPVDDTASQKVGEPIQYTIDKEPLHLN